MNKQEIDILLQGRSIINAYRADINATSEKLSAELSLLGFDYIQDFFDFNEKMILDEADDVLIFEGECNFCNGGELACLPECYNDRSKPDPTTITGRTKLIPNKREILRVIRFYKDHYKNELPVGKSKPILPNCSIMVYKKREYNFDVRWR